MYGALATGCGYAYRAIDRMTLAEAREIFSYWEQNPPPHLLLQSIARLLGWTPAEASAGTSRIDELIAAPPPGLAVSSGGNLGMPAPLLDPDALRTRNLAQALAMARRP